MNFDDIKPTDTYHVLLKNVIFSNEKSLYDPPSELKICMVDDGRYFIYRK